MWQWVILIFLLLITVIYWCIRKPNNYWEKLGVPYVPAKPLIGSINLFSGTAIHEIDQEMYKKHGRYFGIYEGKKPVLMLSDPDLIRNILIKDFQVFMGPRIFSKGDLLTENMIPFLIGEKWKRIRTIISPAFSTGKIRRMTDIILNCAKTVTQNFARKAGEPINGKELFGTFTMDVIASTAFATKIQSFQDSNNKFVQSAKRAFQKVTVLRLMIFIFCPWIMKIFGISIFDSGSIKFFKKVTLAIMEERKRSGQTGDDFLQLLMDAEKETREPENAKIQEVEKNEITTDDLNAAELGHDENNAQIFKQTSKYKSLSQNELIAQCVMFFMAGYETTASTIAFVSYHLALNPEIQEKLSQEVDAVIIKHNRKLTYGAIQEMKYLDKVVTETLRILPPSVRVERTAYEDYKLGETNITVKKGTLVVIPVYAMHHDPEFYPDPEKFDPERFTPEEKAKRHPYTYLTFGAGPRNCLGMRFALMEIKLCLAYVISQLKIKRLPETKVPLEFAAGIALLQAKELIFTVEKRENRVFDGLME